MFNIDIFSGTTTLLHTLNIASCDIEWNAFETSRKYKDIGQRLLYV